LNTRRFCGGGPARGPPCFPEDVERRDVLRRPRKGAALLSRGR
jgi:hypothetical protein